MRIWEVGRTIEIKAMKKTLLIGIIAISLFQAGFVLAEEKINNFDVVVQINTNSTINIEEHINYDFGLANKHGIYRDIPVSYKARGGNYNLRISDIKVVDENNSPYTFSVSSVADGYKRIKIGNANTYVSGQKTYIIKYKIARAINYFQDYDELYWNATGNEWQVSISESSVKVLLPKEIAYKDIKADCFEGSLGSNENCSNINFSTLGQSGTIETIDFSQGFLPSYQGLTIVVGIPKGIITVPSSLTIAADFLKDNLILFLPIIAFIVLFVLWWKKGKDPKGRGVIIAQYDAPDNLTPAEVGTIIDERVNDKDISAEIIHLAIRGYLKIRRTEKKILFAKSIDYEFIKIKQGDDLESDFDKKLFKSIFKTKDEVKLSDLKKDFYKDAKEIKDLVYNSVTKKGYFISNPNKARVSYFTVGIVLLLPIVFLHDYFGSVLFVSLGITGGLIVVFSTIMPKRTMKGVLAREYIRGLKDYLMTAEKERIKFHNAPEKNPELFEKLLPMAMVLGAEKEWAAQFKDIYLTQPSWYESPTGVGFNSVIFIGNLNSFASATHGAITPSRGAAGGGSGFGGGGFSGGGFGGGGGGSW